MKEKQQMKKLMIAAACAAVGLGAFAENTPEVYNMSITVKTTTCKAAQGKNVCDDDYSTFRVKATQKIEGVIWGCDCPTIAEPVVFTTFDAFGTPDSCHGYVFWDNSVKTKNPYETAEFVWSDAAGIFENFLQCINPKCTEVEGVWTLTLKNADDDYLVLLQGAGVGSAKWASQYNAAYIASMSGNVTGWAFPGSLTYGCAACGETYEGCAAWAFCTECEERGDDYPSAAYGTWSLKFNKGSAVKYGKGVTRTAILDAVKFPAAVEAYLIKKDAQEDPDPTDCEKAQALLTAAKNEKTAYVQAINLANQEKVNAEGALKKYVDANQAAYIASNEVVNAGIGYEGSKLASEAATSNLTVAVANEAICKELLEKVNSGLATWDNISSAFNQAVVKIDEATGFLGRQTITELDDAKSAYFDISTKQIPTYRTTVVEPAQADFAKRQTAKAFCIEYEKTVKGLTDAVETADTKVKAAELEWTTNQIRVETKIANYEALVGQLCD